MIDKSNYNNDWQMNRVKYLTSKYGSEFFNGKSLLELGAFNGRIGNEFSKLGAKVTCVEGRSLNAHYITSTYGLPTLIMNMDTPKWVLGDYDIIVNFGLLYHIEYYSSELILNCLNHCKLMFLESEVYDSLCNTLYAHGEYGEDQSLSSIGMVPSPRWIESRLDKYERVDSPELNGNNHTYDWTSKYDDVYIQQRRRFYICEGRLK